MQKRNILNTVNKLNSLPLPEKEKILAACDAVVPEAVSVEGRARSKLQRFTPRKAVVLAMAAMLMVGGSLTVAAAEAKAYNEAIDFFEQYNMSAEGFTRSEVKKIYKDIVSESFTYEKTEEALASGLNGYEIQAQPLDSEGLKRVWMIGYEWGMNKEPTPVSDQYEYQVVRGEYGTATEQIQQIKGGQVRWTVDVGDSIIIVSPDHVKKIGDKAAIAGCKPVSPDVDRSYSVSLALLNEDSTLAWVNHYQCPYADPTINYMLCEDDTITVFVTDFTPDVEGGKHDTLWILTVDLEGNRINEEFVNTFWEFSGLYSAIRVGDSYLVNTRYYGIAKKTGNQLVQLKDFGEDEWDYNLNAMVEFNGLVYISATRHPRFWHYDQFVEENAKDGKISDEAVEKFIKENTTAVLLICDPNTMEMKSFYTLPAAGGDILKVEGNRLTWTVARYSKVESIYDGSYSFTGDLAKTTADVWEYVFTPYGQIVGEKDTGRSETFQN